MNRNWQQFIHPGLTAAQQIIVLGPEPKAASAPPPETFYRLIQDRSIRVTDTGASRVTEGT